MSGSSTGPLRFLPRPRKRATAAPGSATEPRILPAWPSVGRAITKSVLTPDGRTSPSCSAQYGGRSSGGD